MMQNNLNVGPLEMQVLGILDNKEPMNVTSIQSTLKKSGHELAYTTVMTVLTRLYNKGFLLRQKEGRQFLYAVSPQKSMSQKLFDKIRKALFQNDRLKPILTLLDSDSELSVEELTELRNAVNKKIKSSRDKT